jgi:MFS family permease
MAAIPLALASPLLVFVACLLVMVIAMACWRAPLFALMADLTPSAQRTQGNAILNLMAGLGGVLAFVAGSLLYAIYRPWPFWASALVLLMACGLILWLVREPAALVAGRAHANLNFFRHLAAWFSDLTPARRRSMVFLAMAVFCYMLGFHPIEAFFSSYGVTALKLSAANSGLVLSAAYIAFIVFAVPAGMFASRVGRRRTVLGGLALFAMVLMVAFFTPIVSVMVVLMALGGLAWALIDINAFPMVLDTSPGGDGTATGVYFIATTLAATVGPILNGWLIDLSGRNYGVIFLVGPGFFLLSFALMLQVKHGEAVEPS